MIEVDRVTHIGENYNKKAYETPYAPGWKFTDEERKRFENIIQSFQMSIDRKDFEYFIGDLESLCDDMMRIMRLPNREQRKNVRHKMITNLMTIIQDLEAMLKSPHLINPALEKDLKPLMIVTDSPQEWNDFYFTIYLAQQCLDQAIVKIEQIEESDRPEGRPKADTEGFTYRIALLFHQRIGKPSNYDEGPFYEIVRAAHEAVGWHLDPTNHIKRALHKLAIAPTSIKGKCKDMPSPKGKKRISSLIKTPL